ncbi:MAG: hypothetical protein KBD19_03505 [Candidatus Moranbacteria bacterium]|nr:hypothetical protein [Candidatus Moranbacteria bacterium]
MNLSSSILKCLCIPTVIVFIGLVALFVFVALPLREKIAMESDEIQKFRAKIENAERKIGKLPELEVQFSIVKEDERKIPRLLPEANAVDFIKEVEEIAKTVGGEVSIAQGSVVETVKKKSASKEKDADTDASKKNSEKKTIADGLSWEKRLPLRVTFSGEYANAVNFLHKIETMSYRLDVVAVDVRPAVPEEGKRRGGDVFDSVPTEESADAVPIVPEQPTVSAAFDLIVYTE